MANNRRRDKQFDEFFGRGGRGASVCEERDRAQDSCSGDGLEQPSAGEKTRFRSRSERSARSSSRSQAVSRRFNSRSGGVVYVPAAQLRRPDNAPDSSYAPERMNLSAEQSRQAPVPEVQGGDSGDYGFDMPRRPVGRRILGVLLCVILILTVAAAAVFMLRPTDGGDHFLFYRSLPHVSGLRQTRAFEHSAWLDWEPMDSVYGYRIYRTDELTGQTVLVKTAYLSQTLLTGLSQGTAYEYIVRPVCKTDVGEYEESDAAVITVKTMPGEAGDITHLDATADSVTLGWEAADGADGYIVQRCTGSWFDYEDCADSPDAQTTVSGLAPSTEYTFRMRPYVDLGEKRCYGSWSDKFTTASSPEAVYDLSQGETTDSGYVLCWAVDSAVTGFELYRADPDTGEATELLSQCGNDHYEISGLESVNFSSYRVRAFLRHSGGISYGEFSPVLTAVTLPSKVAGVDQYTSADGAYTLSWLPSERAEGYEIYAYSCHRGEYDLLATVTEPEYTIQDISEYAERYRVRAYVSLGSLQFFGNYSDELPCYPYYYLKRTVTVDVDSTTLHAYSGPEHELIAELGRGTSARVFGERSGSDGSRWFRVELKDGTTGWLSREDVSIANTCGTLATREYTDEEPIVIYLSPSRQDGNPYWNGLTTEKEQMEAVGAVTHRILEEEYNCVVYTATPELSLRERAFEALELKADVYLAIHSNATSNGEVQYGASSYYCGASGRSKKLGEAVNSHLNAIAPMPCTLNKQMYSALESFGGVGYAEVRDPYNLGMVSLLAETDFHDNEITGQWIIDNHEAIGRAYAEALAEAFDIPAK